MLQNQSNKVNFRYSDTILYQYNKNNIINILDKNNEFSHNNFILKNTHSNLNYSNLLIIENEKINIIINLKD